jgi:hypothetical protein
MLRRGLDPRHIAQSRACHANFDQSTCYLSSHACEPTGVALGHVLPSRQFSRRLWKLSWAIARRLQTYGEGPTFAFVPPETYHVTVYNRSHFERSEVFALSATELAAVDSAISEAQIGRIAIEFNGLVLTPEGRVIVRGFPHDDKLAQLRHCTARVLPTVDPAPPQLAHIKLGHLLVCPSRPQLRELTDFIAQCSYHVDARLTFEDVYTPLGRLGLG